MKDFSNWNDLKKKINDKDIDKLFVLPREIWWGSLGVNIGVEIDGKGEDFERPILIFIKYGGSMAFALPITSAIPNPKNKNYYFEFQFKNKKSFVCLTQGRTIDIRRLNRKIGTLEEIFFKEIEKNFLEINNTKSRFRGISRRPQP